MHCLVNSTGVRDARICFVGGDGAAAAFFRARFFAGRCAASASSPPAPWDFGRLRVGFSFSRPASSRSFFFSFGRTTMSMTSRGISAGATSAIAGVASDAGEGACEAFGDASAAYHCDRVRDPRMSLGGVLQNLQNLQDQRTFDMDSKSGSGAANMAPKCAMYDLSQPGRFGALDNF